MRNSRPSVDWVFVVAEQNRGWILDGICQEVASRATGTAIVHYGTSDLPPAANYFFSHYLLFQEVCRSRSVRRATTLVWFTHPGWEPGRGGAVARDLRRASGVISGSTTQADALAGEGFDRDAIHIIVPGADPSAFVPHERGSGAVGICTAYYERKNPELTTATVEAMPERQFVLLGRGWEESPHFARLSACSNFTYRVADYEAYPQFYAEIDVLLSPSRLEGGPIPLIEAMMSNVVPVASRTGFGPDLIDHGTNGFLFDVDAGAAAVSSLIDEAFALDTDVRSTVESLTWDHFARQVLALGR